MTIIVYTGTHLIADQVAIRNGRPVRNFKIHHSGHLIWGSAGYVAGPKLLAATSLDALTRVYIEEQALRKDEETLAYFEGRVYFGSFNEDKAGNLSFDWTVALPGACLGSYAPEFECFASRGGEPTAFCEMIADLWGCPDLSYSWADLTTPAPNVYDHTRNLALSA